MVTQLFYEDFPYPNYLSFCHPDGTFLTDYESPFFGRNPDLEAMVVLVGCGTLEAPIIADGLPKSKILGVDISSESLKIAAQVTRANRLNNVYLKQHDITYVSPLPRAADYVLANCCLHHIPEVDLALQNIKATLQPGGILGGTLYMKTAERDEIADAIQRFNLTGKTPDEARELLVGNPWFERHQKSDQEVADTWLNPYYLDYTEDMTTELLERNGFKAVYIDTLPEKNFIRFAAKAA